MGNSYLFFPANRTVRCHHFARLTSPGLQSARGLGMRKVMCHSGGLRHEKTSELIPPFYVGPAGAPYLCVSGTTAAVAAEFPNPG